MEKAGSADRHLFALNALEVVGTWWPEECSANPLAKGLVAWSRIVVKGGGICELVTMGRGHEVPDWVLGRLSVAISLLKLAIDRARNEPGKVSVIVEAVVMPDAVLPVNNVAVELRAVERFHRLLEKTIKVLPCIASVVAAVRCRSGVALALIPFLVSSKQTA